MLQMEHSAMVFDLVFSSSYSVGVYIQNTSSSDAKGNRICDSTGSIIDTTKTLHSLFSFAFVDGLDLLAILCSTVFLSGTIFYVLIYGWLANLAYCEQHASSRFWEYMCFRGNYNWRWQLPAAWVLLGQPLCFQCRIRILLCWRFHSLLQLKPAIVKVPDWKNNLIDLKLSVYSWSAIWTLPPLLER